MNSRITVIGQPPFSLDEQEKLVSRIGTVFPRHAVLVTLPGVHVTQRNAFIDELRRWRKSRGQEPLGRMEEEAEWNEAVDLIIDPEDILIRPDPANMPLAFQADDLLQEMVPKQHIKFLGLLNDDVREAIKKRGEWWRITPLPKTPEEMKEMILASRIRVSGGEIYYYNKLTGTRFLTCREFAGLDALDDEALLGHLREIRDLLKQNNAHGRPELSFFPKGAAVGKADFTRLDLRGLNPEALRSSYREIRDRFQASVPAPLRSDDPAALEWRNAMVAALVGKDDTVISEEKLIGLSPEFFMRVEWLPGGRIEDGELVFDSVLQQAAVDPAMAMAVDEKPQKFIFNFVREYGDLEFVNIGRVTGSLSRRPALYGRRGVYIAVLKQRQSREEIVSIIRLQKQGVREYLEEGYSLLEAMVRSEEYTEYILDRRLGCRQLGMNLPVRATSKKISERYSGPGGETITIWTPYFEREYIAGIATDKIPPYRFELNEFAVRTARLLGRAAAANIVVGRSDLQGVPLFDDGDEVLICDDRGMPLDIVVTDHTGTFNDFTTPLSEFAAHYARPASRRATLLPNPRAFADAYTDSFVGRLRRIQEEYRRRRRAFDTLFSSRPRREEGSFAHRWQMVLERLDSTDPLTLAALIRESIAV
jgi:hypothetical protein